MTDIRTPSLQDIKNIVERHVDLFEPVVRLIYGGRGSGKTTALTALDVIAEERGLRSLVVVPFSDMGKLLVRFKEEMLQSRVSDSNLSRHYYTVQRLARESGLRPELLLIDEWGMYSKEDQVRIYQFWRMWRPAYTFVAVASNHLRGSNLYIAHAEFQHTVLSEEERILAPKGTPEVDVQLIPLVRSTPREKRLW